MPRAAVAQATTKAKHTAHRLLHEAYLALGHLELDVEVTQRKARRGYENGVSFAQQRLLLGWEVYAEARSDEFSGGRTHEEECELEDMLRLAGRL